MNEFSSVSAVLDELVPVVEQEEPAWDDVLTRVERLETASLREPVHSHATDGAAAVGAGAVRSHAKPRRWWTRRRLVAPAIVAALLAVLFATPAFGLLLDLIGRTNVPFTGKTAPYEVKREFFDLSLGAPPGMAPEAIASQARRVAVFHAFGHAHVLYVAPTRKGGFCETFTQGFGGCRQTRTPPRRYPSQPGAVNPFLLGLDSEGSPVRISKQGALVNAGRRYTLLVGGDILARNAASVSVEYEDRSSTAIPFVYVSKPIDAGFFYYQIPDGHKQPGTRAAAVIVRDKQGKVLSREPITYAPLHIAPRPLSPRPVPSQSPTPKLPPPTPPLQHGSSEGVSVVAGQNGVVRFDTTAAPASIRALIRNGSYGCFRFMRYHEDAPAGVSFGPRAMSGTSIRIFGLPTPYDGCEIQGSYGHTWPDRLHGHSAVEIAFTPAGERLFADRAAARDLALFVRSKAVQQIRKHTGATLQQDLRGRYGQAITGLASTSAPLPAGQIGYVINGDTSTFIERSTTGKQFYVRIVNGDIEAENVKPLAFVF